MGVVKNTVRTGTRVVRGGLRRSAPLIMAMASVDPEGTHEFIDDIVHLRGGKIIDETGELIEAVTDDPLGVLSGISSDVVDSVSNYYAGTDGVLDGVGRTAMVPVHGLVNVGSVEWATLGSVGDVAHSGINWIMEVAGCDTRLIQDEKSVRAFKRDPFGFIGSIFAPGTVDIHSGLRSDDTFFTIINRGDAKSLQAYIANGADVNEWIHGYQGDADTITRWRYGEKGCGTYITDTRPIVYAASQNQLDLLKILLDNRHTWIHQSNEATGQTPLMMLMYDVAPEEGTHECFSGRPVIPTSQKWRVNFAKRHILIQMIIQDARSTTEVLNMPDCLGETPFLYATKVGYVGTESEPGAIRLLVAKGVDVHHRNRWGQNALHLAACNHSMTFYLLDELHLDANVKDNDGKTPLMTALEYANRYDNKNKMVVLMLIGELNEEGFRALRSSSMHSELLNAFLDEFPVVKQGILQLDDENPLKKEMIAQNPGVNGRLSVSQICSENRQPVVKPINSLNAQTTSSHSMQQSTATKTQKKFNGSGTRVNTNPQQSNPLTQEEQQELFDRFGLGGRL